MELKLLWVGAHDDESLYVGEDEKAARDHALDDSRVSRWLCAVEGERATLIQKVYATFRYNGVTLPTGLR